MEMADTESFVPLSLNYSRDKQNIFYERHRVAPSKTEKFTITGEHTIQIGDSVYCGAEKLNEPMKCWRGNIVTPDEYEAQKKASWSSLF